MATRYYANNRKQSFKQTFTWSDVHNAAINQLSDFADAFLDKCHVSKMIAKYTVLHEGVDYFNFSGQNPLRDDIVAALKVQPRILERRKVVNRILERLVDFIRTFEDDVGEV